MADHPEMMAEVSKLVRDAYGIGDSSTITEEAEGQEELPLDE